MSWLDFGVSTLRLDGEGRRRLNNAVSDDVALLDEEPISETRLVTAHEAQYRARRRRRGGK